LRGGLDLGFINATFDLGKLESEKAKTRGGGADVIDDYLQLPMPLIEDEAKRGKVIRVWMKVESDESANDPETKELNVSGISRMDLVDYWAGSEEDDEKKRRYLYRDPVGSNTSWGFPRSTNLAPPKPMSGRRCWGKTTNGQPMTKVASINLKKGFFPITRKQDVSAEAPKSGS